MFAQDAGTIHVLVVSPAYNSELFAVVRTDEGFEQVTTSIPATAEWVDPERFEPITEVRAGGNLLNSLRGQRGADGSVHPGVVFVGDAVLTTNPTAGRGVSLGFQMARQLVLLLDEERDLGAVAARFEAWCEAELRPWYEDHVHWDLTEVARFRGEDLDVDGRIPSDVICACAERDPSMLTAVGPFLGMVAGPAILDSVQEQARAMLRTGWRPAYAPGPSATELVALTALASR